MQDLLGDISRAHAGFGYVPRYGMEDGLFEMIGCFGGASFRSIYERDMVNMW